MDDVTELVRTTMPLCATLRIIGVEALPERVVLDLPWDRSLCTAGGVMHGGALMALADSAGGVCAFLNLPEGATGTATIESTTHFFRPVVEGTVVATATPLHIGRMTIVIEVELRADNRIIGKATQTQTVHRPSP